MVWFLSPRHFCLNRSRLPGLARWLSTARSAIRPRLEILEDRFLLSISALPGLSFVPGTGLLSLPANVGTVTLESSGPGEYLRLVGSGWLGSSDPRAADFDVALAGATRQTLSAVTDASSATLTLSDLDLTGGLAVRSADVILTGALTFAGNLNVQADQLDMLGQVAAGNVSLNSSGLVNIAAEANITGQVGQDGSAISITATTFLNAGVLHADGATGGTISISAGNVLQAGTLTADSATGAAGTIQIAFTGSYVDTAAALLAAKGIKGGTITVEGGPASRLFSSGTVTATGADGAGGSVRLLGNDVLLVGATVDVSGAAGGSIRIGGGLHGGEGLPTAATVSVDATTVLQADARAGPGGSVVVWSTQNTTFAGSIKATAAAGSGGTVEVSSAGTLDDAGAVDAGTDGSLLLDPHDLTLDASTGALPQFSITDPTGENQSFATITQVVEDDKSEPAIGGFQVLPDGNLVVLDPLNNFSASQAGAVFLINGQTGQLISMLTGSSAHDRVGEYVTVLTNGNFVTWTSDWTNTTTGAADAGAVTWVDGMTGLNGAVSATNSLVGSSTDDGLYDPAAGAENPSPPVLVALSNGNYVVDQPGWDDPVTHAMNVGAVTWGNGQGGTGGTISSANSLVGSSAGDVVGADGLIELTNGNYVVGSPFWNGGRGAVTWGNGAGGTAGALSSANSLVGSTPGDFVGGKSGLGVTPLTNGNYVVASSFWSIPGGNQQVGAATWGNGLGGTVGPVASTNSLVGASTDDAVGLIVTPLTNGNYVVDSQLWSNPLTGTPDVGAVTWANGTQPTSGTVSAANSLIGSTQADATNNIVMPLSNGNYVVATPFWDNPVTGSTDVGRGHLGEWDERYPRSHHSRRQSRGLDHWRPGRIDGYCLDQRRLCGRQPPVEQPPHRHELGRCGYVGERGWWDRRARQFRQ